MAEEVLWPGASGHKYKYTAYPIDTDLKSLAGNYIMTRHDGNTYYAVYIGEGDLKTRSKDPEHLACAKGKGANEIHAHVNSIESARLAEEQDLLAIHVEAYTPSGCNKKEGG